MMFYCAACEIDCEELEICGACGGRTMRLGATIGHAHPFDAERDSEALRKALKGMFVDKKAVAAIAGTRSTSQLKEVASIYKAGYGRDLEEELKHDLGGKFEVVVLGRFMTPIEYDAHCLRHAMKGMGSDHKAMLHVICGKTNFQIEALKATYQEMFDRDLEHDVAHECGGDFKRFLVALLEQGRGTHGRVDEAMAEREAHELYDAGEGRWFTEGSAFIKILSLRSDEQLRATFAAYGRISKLNFVQAVDKEFHGDTKLAMVALVEMIQDPLAHYATVLYHAMKGWGTDDKALERIIISRCEIDLCLIAEKFRELYGETLLNWVQKETSGDYGRLMQALVKGNGAHMGRSETMESRDTVERLSGRLSGRRCSGRRERVERSDSWRERTDNGIC